MNREKRMFILLAVLYVIFLIQIVTLNILIWRHNRDDKESYQTASVQNEKLSFPIKKAEIPKDEWLRQGLADYSLSLRNLENALALESPDMVQRAGLIHFFEISFELSWKVMKGHLEAGGYQNIRSPRDAIEQFYDLGLIHDDTQWLQGLEDRDLTAYTYNDANAHKVILLIHETYYPLMVDLEETLKGL